MWGAKIKWPADMPDDILKFSVDTATTALEECEVCVGCGWVCWVWVWVCVCVCVWCVVRGSAVQPCNVGAENTVCALRSAWPATLLPLLFLRLERSEGGLIFIILAQNKWPGPDVGRTQPIARF